MGFFFALIGYLTAVALMIGGAAVSALWVTQPPPPPPEKAVVVTAPAKLMHGAHVALKPHAGKKHRAQRHR